ncbi:MAG: SdpI family protein [Clostridia bacterium]|nr:SdpI family protein [Clostridia bacterium]
MTNKNKIKLIITSVITLLPMLFGLLMWEKLPESMTLHWGIDGKADGMGSPLTVVIVLPLILLVLHWLCIGITAWDNKRKGQSEKVINITFWILPIISLVISTVIYCIALGYEWNFLAVICFLLGILFLIIGNYLPKCKQNRTIGIKLRWTIANEENWNRTHRLGGKVSVITGLLCFPTAFLPAAAFPIAMLLLVAANVGIPTVYSYRFYKKQLREGTATKEDYALNYNKNQKKYTIISLILGAVILTGCAVLTVTGDINVQYGETSFTAEATYWEDLTVNYADIDTVEYRAAGVDGTRVSGFGSFRLSLGLFRNEEFGNYTRYTYAQCTPCIVLTSGEKILVIGLENEEQTKVLYEELLLRTGK